MNWTCWSLALNNTDWKQLTLQTVFVHAQGWSCTSCEQYRHQPRTATLARSLNNTVLKAIDSENVIIFVCTLLAVNTRSASLWEFNCMWFKLPIFHYELSIEWQVIRNVKICRLPVLPVEVQVIYISPHFWWPTIQWLWGLCVRQCKKLNKCKTQATSCEMWHLDGKLYATNRPAVKLSGIECMYVSLTGVVPVWWSSLGFGEYPHNECCYGSTCMYILSLNVIYTLCFQCSGYTCTVCFECPL